MFVARMITRSKWEPKPGICVGEIAADAVTGDLRTKDNTLSFWRCPSGTNGDFKDAALAIAAGRDDVAKMEIVWLDDGDLKADGQTLLDTDGRTPVHELVDRHLDVRQLDYGRLGKIAHLIVSALSKGQHLLLTRARVKKLITSAVAERRVSLDDLQDKVRAEIQKSLAAES